MNGEQSELARAAIEARGNAYAPYSEYKVGAAAEDEKGRIFTGSNIENVSYGATMCAERVAVFKLVSEGGKSVARLAVAMENGGTPCGLCLQVMQEFAPNPEQLEIVCVSSEGVLNRYTLKQLLPHAFELPSDERKGH